MSLPREMPNNGTPPPATVKKGEMYVLALATFLLGYGAGFMHGNSSGKRKSPVG